MSDDEKPTPDTVRAGKHTINQYREAIGLQPFEFAEANVPIRMPRRPWWKRLLAKLAR